MKFIKKIWLSYFRPRLSVKEQTFLIKRLSFLISAGVPLHESLSMLLEQTRSKKQKIILKAILDDIGNGLFLSTSLSIQENAFGEFAINIIRIGESTGLLSENLSYLADELRKKQILKRKIIGAFIYPAIVTLATFGITIFLILYLFPKIMPVFASLHIKLPLSTRIVIFINKMVTHDGFLILGILFVLSIVFFIALKKIPRLHFYFDLCILKIPIIGKVIEHYNLASATRTLGILLKSGITISEALPILVNTTKNLVYRKEFLTLALVVDRGEKMSEHLKTKRNIFPDVVSQIISVGERSGNLSNSLTYVSELYDGEIDDFTKNISSIIEPVLMICMGLVVGFIAISIITPIYSITQNLHP
ncbi:MAG: type II secretion system F family protein [Patescibacteria group bacterium]